MAYLPITRLRGKAGSVHDHHPPPPFNEEPDEESERGRPEPLADVLRRAFAAWAGPTCPTCNLPAVLHGECCDEDER